MRACTGGDEIVTAFIKYHSSSQPSSANPPSSRPTLLYSHGNAVDLGQMLPVYRCEHWCIARLEQLFSLHCTRSRRQYLT
eukprot:403291-Pelagomonas_calceolata.AAC.3